MLMATITVSAQDIKLPTPDLKQNSLPVVEALNTRHSVREYETKELTTQQISNLCWAACGVSRDAEHRTAPTAMNRREIRLFVLTSKGAYEYLPESNTLKEKAKGDHRRMAAGTSGFSQDFVLAAPVSLIMVIDYDKFGSQDENAKRMCCIDAGIVSENINLYCQAVGLATVTRATLDSDGLRKLFNLTENQLPILNNPVGYEKGK